MVSFIFGIIFLTASMLCFGTSYYFYKKSKAKLAKSIKVQGTVVDFKDSDKVYYPIFEFQPPTGNPVTIQATVGHDPPAYKIGEKVTVVFDPRSPHEAKLDNLFQNYLEALISCGAGGFILIFGLVFSLFF